VDNLLAQSSRTKHGLRKNPESFVEVA